MKCQHRIRQSAERLLVGANPEPLSKIAQRKEKYHNEKTEQNDHYPLYR